MVDLNNMEQVTKMTESCQILSDTLNLVEKYIVPGQSVLELDKIAEDYIVSKDGIPAFKGYKLSSDDQLRQFVIMELMSNFSLNIPRVEDRFNIVFNEYFKDDLKELAEFVEADLLSINDDKIQVSSTGTMLIRNICMPFDAYLKKVPENKRRFSKTI